MSKKIVAKKVSKKVKTRKFKLITYTMKAIIPTGMYANLQPEITVQADTIEHAERAVMPHIEALFAKYREGGSPIQTPQPARPVVVQVAPKPVAPVPVKETPVEKTPDQVKASRPEDKFEIVAPPPTIIMTVPFTRAKSAIDSCVSLDALKLVTDQIGKSEKLIQNEKLELLKMAESKKVKLTNDKTINDAQKL